MTNETTDGVDLPAAMSRRRFLRVSGAGALGLVGGGLLLSACGGTSHATTGAAGAAIASAAKKKPSAPLMTVLSADPAGIDIVKYSDTAFLSWADLVYERLVRYDENRSIVPLLCSASPTVSSDLLTYTFPLRSGVTFHNGAPFTSEDVKYSFDILGQPGSEWDLGPVDSVTTTDPHTVVVKLKQPFTYFLDFIALTPMISKSVPYSPATYGKTMVGTGPYKFVRHVPNSYISLERFSSYRDNTVSSIPKITLNIIPEEDAQLSALAAGTIQLIPSVSSKLVSLAKSRGAVVQMPPYNLEQYWVACNFRPGRATTNVNLRLAMSWAINRDRIVQQVFNGYGHPLSTMPGSASYYYDAAYGNYFGGTPDLAKAKHYLALAGGAPTKTLDFAVGSEDPNMVAACTLVQQDLAAIGIRSNIQTMGEAAMLSTLFDTGDWDISGYQGNAESLAPDYPYFEFLPSGGADYIMEDNPQMVDAINAAFSAPRGAKAEAGIAAIQKEYVELAPYLMLAEANNLSANSSKLVNYTASNFYDLWPLVSASVVS